MKKTFTFLVLTICFSIGLMAQICPTSNQIRNGSPRIFFMMPSEIEANFYEDTQTSGSGITDCGGASCDNLISAVLAGQTSVSGTAVNVTIDKVRDHTDTEIKFNDGLPVGVLPQETFVGTVTFNFSSSGPLECIFAAVLPVMIADFKADVKGKTILLEWTTGSEINNDFFSIERSADGEKFESISIIEGVGNSNDFVDYRFVDEQAQQGMNYYRLRQVDFDGTESFSEVVLVQFRGTEDNQLDVYPTLVKGELNINLTKFTSKEVSFEIYNINGKLVGVHSVMTGDIAQINTSYLTEGMYFGRLIVNNATFKTRFIVRN